jgi:Arc/MetJ family transcription regulator
MAKWISSTGRMNMAKTLIDVDDELLDEATTALGTSTKKDTVNEALRKVVNDSRARRAQALENLQRIAAEGGFNFDLLDDLDR